MIDRTDVLTTFRQEIANSLDGYKAPPPTPLAISPWIAMSLLQKGIRRGEKVWGTAAAATLFFAAPDKLWRRLAGIAAEDIGLADICATGAMAGMMAGKRLRGSIGGEWTIAAWLTQRLCEARTSRATDDLLMAAQLLPSLQGERERLAGLSNHHLRLTLLGTESLHVRALALLYLAGTAGKPLDHLLSRRGDPALAFDVLDELGTPLTVLELAREGYRVSREPLWLLMGLLAAEPAGFVCETQIDDDIPPETITGPVPGWALDAFTREGKGAISRFLHGDSPYTRCLQACVERSQQRTVTALALFHVEGGLLRNRCRSALTEDLRATNERECLGLLPELAQDALHLLRDDLPRLDTIRADILEGQTHA
ncbi:MAG: hypothetical protein AB7F96_07990 [Beijerinckiaceae bacterium]